jgi:hypothetical protein
MDGVVPAAELESQIEGVSKNAGPDALQSGLEPAKEKVDLTKNAWISALKQTDQLTPVRVKELAFTKQVIFVLLTCLVFGASFSYVIAQNTILCTEDNGCRVCTPQLKDDPTMACDPQSHQSLNFAAGCFSFSVANNFTAIDEVMKYDVSQKLAHLGNERLISSIRAHEAVWECFKPNKDGQVQDPDDDCAKSWTSKHWAGINDNLFFEYAYGQFGQALTKDPAMQAARRPYLLKLISSLFTIKAVLFSANQDGINIVELNPPTKLLAVGLDAAFVTTNAGHAGNPDWSLGKNGRGFAVLQLPVEYIASASAIPACTNGVWEYTDPTDPTDDDGGGGGGGPCVVGREATMFPEENEADVFTVEWVHSNPDNLQQNFWDAHCPSANVFTTTPNTLFSGIYTCCIEKALPTVLAEANAFSAFVLSMFGISAAILFMPFSTGSVDKKAMFG